MDRPPRNQQQFNLDAPPDPRRRYCRRCHRPLSRPESRAAGYGPTCDPTSHPHAAPARDIDQDTLPGT
ncbi:DUF6011 domain-containing protein [Streptomyces sp. NBC_01435]|uniref:DUF6011 domain-containing protein n=1 Tax=Streptomyces sp. NBC_01435 TaxID=2903865 RepID=UPI002E3473CF|nr:DUF6011 domain-containing protein [Streptomyces sp. NBC_01435]